MGGAKQQLLLTALILARNNVVSTDRLVELIWGAHPPAKPYENLRAYVSHLRRLLEPERSAGRRGGLVVTRSPGYAIDIEAGAVDVFEFEERLGRARRLLDTDLVQTAADELSAALRLWRSSDLDDSPLAGFGAERDRLLELRLQARILQFECGLAAGEHALAIADLRPLVDAEPLRERPRALLMTALYRAGRAAEALEVYQEGYRASVEATGLDPAPGLKELENQILRNDPALDWVPPEERRFGPTGVTGRRRETALLADALSSPSGELVVMTGEPGIGKTHLLDHAADLAGRSGVTVAWGVGHPGHQSLTLAPWRALLSALVAAMDDQSLRALGEHRTAELAHLLPELTDRLGVPVGGGGDESALHDAVVHLLTRAVARSPVLLCCDDVHWYDPASVRLLTSVVVAMKAQPLVVAAAWRDTEPTDPDRAAALTELGAAASRRRVLLTGLDAEAVTHLWTEHLDASPDEQAVERLRRRTAGNPLFITELLQARRDAASSAPTATIQDLIAAQVAALPTGCEELLTICALCPEGATERLLARVSGMAADRLGSCVDALLANRMLVEVTSSFPSFVVRHSVIAECLVARLTASAQSRYHNRIAEALRSQHIPAGRLAHHLLGGGAASEPEATASAALEAARYSAGLHDHAGAIDLIERGLVALDRSDDDQLRGELMVLLAQQRKHVEHIAQAHDAALEAFRLARRAGDVDLMVKAALVYCGQNVVEIHYGSQWLGYWHPPGPALEMLAECLEKLESGATKVVVQAAYANQLFGEHHDPEQCRAVFDEAIEEARTLGQPALLSSLLHYRMMALQRELSFEERRALVDEGLALVDAGESPHREIVARRDRLLLRLDADDASGAEDEVARSLVAARRTDDSTIAMLTASMSIALDLYRGDFAQAEQAISESFTRFERMGSAGLDLFGIQLATLSRERGAHGEVADMLGWKLSGYPGPAYGLPLALVLAELGELDRARDLLEQFRAPATVLAGESVLQFMTLSFGAELALALGDEPLAADVHAALAPAAGRTVAMFSGITFYGSGSLYLGRLATMLGRLDEAATHLEVAERSHRAVGSRPYLLRTLLARAELLRAQGTPHAPDDPLTAEAAALADELGMGWLLTRPVPGP
ncbi:MAG: BTAD domain-containing putative transcriptional regulator [Actinomycetota bacterium]